jgi:uncharacterized membrane protein YdbT with pleckstrin-like domain
MMENDDEIDLWWGSSAGRAMAVDFAVCAVTTVLLLAAGMTLEMLTALRGFRTGAIGVSLLIWVVQIARWVYSTTSTNYRLTTRRVLIDCGFFHPLKREMPLSEVGQVEVEQRPHERIVGVGRIKILADDVGEPIVFTGVRHPERVAAEIRKQARQARAADGG